MDRAVKEKIKGCWAGKILWYLPMSRLSTLRVGGPAEAVIYPGSQKELAALVAALNKAAVSWLVIGRGSNILAADQGLQGVVIVLGNDFGEIRPLAESGKVYVEAGCSLAKLTGWCAKHGLSGLEFAVGIPGSVGGAIKMNAGAWGSEIAEVIEEVGLMDRQGNFYNRSLNRSDFSYRAWHGVGDQVITSGVFNLQQGLPEAEILARGRELFRKRRIQQPQGAPSAGSFFKNPPGDAAGRLIEQAGLKGIMVGGAMVSEVHANFLVNSGKATAYDFFRLMRLIQEKVQSQFGVLLEPEVEFIGHWE